jgi:hypothetical protein
VSRFVRVEVSDPPRRRTSPKGVAEGENETVGPGTCGFRWLEAEKKEGRADRLKKIVGVLSAEHATNVIAN